MSDSTNPFGQVIHSYTRAQAIHDGVLVDLSEIPLIVGAWKGHIACTAAFWGMIINSGEDPAVACFKITINVYYATNSASQEYSGTLHFAVHLGGELQAMKLHCGPGDAGEPVFTLMLPHED